MAEPVCLGGRKNNLWTSGFSEVCPDLILVYVCACLPLALLAILRVSAVANQRMAHSIF